MATSEELAQVITAFAQHYDHEGFVACDHTTLMKFNGQVLLNYKGLRLLRFRKSQAQPELDPAKFHHHCSQAAQAGKESFLENLMPVLRQHFPGVGICVLVGDNIKTVGEWTKFSAGQLHCLLF